MKVIVPDVKEALIISMSDYGMNMSFKKFASPLTKKQKMGPLLRH